MSLTNLSKYAYLTFCCTGEGKQASASKVGHVAGKRLQPVRTVEPGGFWDLEELRSSEGGQLPQQREHLQETVGHLVSRFSLLLPGLHHAVF